VSGCGRTPRRRARAPHDLVDGRDEVDRQVAPQLLADVLEDALLVLPRQDDVAEADAARGQHLLLDAADRQHLARERDLARHRDVAAHWPPDQLGHERGRHGDAGGRAVLGDGA
jgi:hypothetical protein